MRVLRVQPRYEGAGHSRENPAFVSLGAEAPGCVYCVQGCGAGPEAGGGAKRGERGETLVRTARAKASRTGEQGSTGLSTPE